MMKRFFEAIVLSLATLALPTLTRAVTLVPLNGGMELTCQFVNNSGVPDNQVYILVLARDAGGTQCYLNAVGALIPVVGGQNTSMYSMTLNTFTGLQFPPTMTAGRLWISYGVPLNMATFAGGGIAQPNLGNPGDPNINTKFDWMEFTIGGGQFFGNTTQVDMFGIPYTMELYDDAGGGYSLNSKRGITACYDDVAAQYQAFMNTHAGAAAFNSLVGPVRIVAPVHGSFGGGQPNSNYFDTYIANIWSGPFRPAGVAQPTTQDVFGATGPLATLAAVDAALNRHIIDNPANVNNPAAYYQTAAANFYAAFWHQINLAGFAYGFPYDDSNNQSSLQVSNHPRGLVITLSGCVPSPTSTRTNTVTSTSTRTATPSRTPTVSLTSTATITSTATATLTRTSTASATVTATRTITPTHTASSSSTASPSRTATSSATSSRTVTSTFSETAMDTATDSPTITSTRSATPSSTATHTSTSSVTATRTVTVRSTQTPSFTQTVTTTASNTQTPTDSVTLSSSSTPSSTAAATATGTSSPGPSATNTSSSTISPTPTHFTPAPFIFDLAVFNSAGERVRVLVSGGHLSKVPVDWKLLDAVALPDTAKPALILAGGQVFPFDGTNDQAQALANGTYYARLSMVDPFGKTTAYSAAIAVMRDASRVSLCVSNSAGEFVRCLSVIASGGGSLNGTTQGRDVLSDNSLAPGKAVTLQWDNAHASWDGNSADGLPVQSGLYTLTLVAHSTGGTVVKTWQVTVLQGPTPALTLKLNSNPWRNGRLKVYGATGAASAMLYNGAGEKVAETNNGEFEDRGYASGVYILVVTQGRLRASMKVAVLR